MLNFFYVFIGEYQSHGIDTLVLYAALDNKTTLIEKMIELGCDPAKKIKDNNNEIRFTTLNFIGVMGMTADTFRVLLSKKAGPNRAGRVSSLMIFCTKSSYINLIKYAFFISLI